MTINFSTFLAKLEEAKKCMKEEDDEVEDEKRNDERADKKADRRGRKYPVKMHDGDDDGKNLGEEAELDEEEKSIKAVDVKTALKNVKNASSHTKKMIKANPTQKMPHGSSRHAAYSEEFELDESVKIIDRDSDLDQEHFKLSVNGKPVHFVHHNYEGGHATDSKQDIHYQVKNQLKHLSDADKKKVTDTVHASYRMKEEFELDEGQTIKTKTGVIHKGSYGSEYETDEEGNEKKKEAPAVKRGRGRPKKGSDESGNVKKYTFHDLLNKLSR